MGSTLSTLQLHSHNSNGPNHRSSSIKHSKAPGVFNPTCPTFLEFCSRNGLQQCNAVSTGPSLQSAPNFLFPTRVTVTVTFDPLRPLVMLPPPEPSLPSTPLTTPAMSLRRKRIDFNVAFDELKRDMVKMFDFSGTGPVSGMGMYQYVLMHANLDSLRQTDGCHFPTDTLLRLDAITDSCMTSATRFQNLSLKNCTVPSQSSYVNML